MARTVNYDALRPHMQRRNCIDVANLRMGFCQRLDAVHDVLVRTFTDQEVLNLRRLPECRCDQHDADDDAGNAVEVHDAGSLEQQHADQHQEFAGDVKRILKDSGCASTDLL